MLDRGLLTINDDDPLKEQLQLHRTTRDRKSEQFIGTVQQALVRKVEEGVSPQGGCTEGLPTLELSNVKIEQELMEQMYDDDNDDRRESDRAVGAEGEATDEGDRKKNLPKLFENTPSILKSSLLAGAAATLASLSTAPGAVVQLTTGTKIKRITARNTATEITVKPVIKTFRTAFNTATLTNTTSAISTTATTIITTANAISNSTTTTATMESKRLSEATTASQPTYASTSFLQTALMSAQLNVSTGNAARRQQQQLKQQQSMPFNATHPVHVLKSAMTLASLSEIATARQEFEQRKHLDANANKQSKPHQAIDVTSQLLVMSDKPTLSFSTAADIMLASTVTGEPSTSTPTMLKICSCHAVNSNASGSKLQAIKSAGSTKETGVSCADKYQATSTQTVKMPTIRTATATTQTQTDELLEMPLATRMPRLLTIDKATTTTATTTTATTTTSTIIAMTTKSNTTTLSVVPPTQATKPAQTTTTTTTTTATTITITTSAATRTSATTTATTTASSSTSSKHVKMTAVPMPKQHLTQTTTSMPSTSMLIERNQAQQLVLLQSTTASQQTPTLNTNRFPTHLNPQHVTPSSASHLRHQQHHHHHQQQETVVPTSNAAVTVVVFKTMLPDD